MPKKLMTTPQVADLLGVRPKTVDQWRREGEGPTYLRIGGTVRYDPTDVDTWLQGRRRQSGYATSDLAAH